MFQCLFNKYAGLKAWNFIKKRLQHRGFPVKSSRFLRTPFFTEHIWLLLLEISHELSLYGIWEQLMVSFGGTYSLSSAYFILLRVFRFFRFVSFFYYLCVCVCVCVRVCVFVCVWILLLLLLFGFELS